MCGKDETKTVENRPPEEIMAAYRDLLGRSQSLIDQPDQFYSGDRLAGFTPQQQQAFQTIAGAGNVMDPYLEKASSYLDRAGTPIAPMAFSPEAVNQYMSPYIGNVVNATQAQFSNQNLAEQAKLMGNMASAGAWGGNRSAVLQPTMTPSRAVSDIASTI